MARVVNEILTKSTTQGFPQTGKQVDELSKKQTRLANESTNNARTFSAQASGLGGLVAAYAGAAATTFALQQSFSALNVAARSQAMVEGVTSLAQSVGQNGPRIIASLQGITRGQLSLTEAAQNASIAIAAGLGDQQIEELADIATKASKALGRDLTDSMQRLVRGVGKLEPELLDELGIFTRIEPAVERYAAKLGRAASSLTNFERRQAFANAVAEEGTLKFKNVDTSVTDSAQNLNKLVASLSDLVTKIGQTIVNIFDPLVSYFNQDLSRLAGLLIGLGVLVFAKLGQVTREGIDSLVKRIDDFAARTTKRFTESTRSVSQFNAAILEAQKSASEMQIRNYAGPREQQAATREAIKRIREGNIAPSELPGLRQAIQTQIATERNLGRPASIARAESLQGLLTNLGTASQAVTPRVSALGTAITSVGSGIGVAAAFMGKFLGLLGVVATSFAIIDFFLNLVSLFTGLDLSLGRVITKIGGFFSELFKGFTDARKANQAFVSSFSSGDDAIKRGTTNLTAYNKALENTPERLEKIIKEAKPEIEFTRILLAAQSRLNFRDMFPNAAQDVDAAREKLAASRRKSLEKGFDKEIAALRKNISAKNDAEREQALIEIQLLQSRKQEYLQFYDDMVQALGDFGEEQRAIINQITTVVSKRLGLAVTDVTAQVRQKLVTITDGAVSFKSFDKTVETAARSAEELEEGLTPLERSIIITSTAADKLVTAMMSSSVESSTLQNYLESVNKSYAELSNSMYDSDDAIQAQIKSMFNLKTQIEGVIERLRTLEQTEKDLKDIFGGSIQRTGRLVAGGDIGIAGGVAFTSEAQKANQLTYLDNVFRNNESITSLESKKVELMETLARTSIFDLNTRFKTTTQLAKVNKELEVGRNTQKALLGESIEFIRTMDQLVKVEEKKTKEMVHQYQMLLDQNALAQSQRNEEKKQLEFRLNAEQKSIDNQLKIARMEAGLRRLENANLYLDLSIKENERTAQRLQLEEQVRDVRAESAKLATSRTFLQGNLALERELALMQAFGGLAGEQTQEQKQFELQIRQKEEQIAETAIDMKTAAEKNTGAALIEKSNAFLKLQIVRDEKALVDKRAAIEKERLRQDFAVRYAEMDERTRQLGVAKTQADQRANLDKKQIQFDKEIQLFELDLVEERYRQLDIQSQIFDRHTKELASIFGREAGGRAADVENIPRERRNQFIKDFEDQYLKDLGLARDRAQITVPTQIGVQRGAVIAGAFERTQEADRIATAAKDRAQAEIDAIVKRKTATQQLEIQQKALIELEAEANRLRADDAIKAAQAEEAAANLRYTIRQTELQNEVERLRQTQDRQKAELELLKQLKALKGDNLFVALADSVKIFRDQTTEFITTMLTDVMNGTKKASDVFKSFMLNLALEIQKTIVRRTISEPLANGIADIFGGALKGAASGSTSWITSGGIFGGGEGSLFASMTGRTVSGTELPTAAFPSYVLNKAIGGHVRQMASGGSAGLRDRVPALLEPGEFVIRRPAAMAIGGQTLSQMNATGQVVPGNVMVNVVNQGTPQTVQGTPQITRQGENLVIDIIVKDIQNNGPIRQTLKGMR